MTTTYNQLVSEVLTMMRGYGLAHPISASLTDDLTEAGLSVVLDDGTGFAAGFVEIGDEMVDVQLADSGNLTLWPDGRAACGTTAVPHAAGTRATMNPPLPRHQIGQAINDTILGLAPDLFGVGSTTFTYTPGQYTYALPADVTNILVVSADTYGPSRDQAEINRYRLDQAAPTSVWPTGRTITLRETPMPGRTVTVTYAKDPSMLAPGDDLSASGLRETARRAVLYGAVAHLLTTLDATRIFTKSAVEQEFNHTQNQVTVATTLAAQMTARYEIEKAAEQRRLRQDFPPRVRIASR